MPSLATFLRRKMRALTSVTVSLPGSHDEAVRARHAFRVEQRVDRELLRLRVGPLDPELGEARELLARAERGVDGEPARRQAVPLVLAQRAEIARALEHEHLVLVLRRVERVVHAKAGEAEVAKRRLVELVLAVVEELGIEADLAHARRRRSRRSARAGRSTSPGERAGPRTAGSRARHSDRAGLKRMSRYWSYDELLQRLREVAVAAPCTTAPQARKRAWRRPRSRTRRRLPRRQLPQRPRPAAPARYVPCATHIATPSSVQPFAVICAITARSVVKRWFESPNGRHARYSGTRPAGHVPSAFGAAA